MQVSPLEPKPRIDVSGAEYLVWEAGPIPPGRGIVLQFANLPQPGLATRAVKYVTGTELWLTAIPAALAAALTALLLWAWFRGPRTAGVGDAAADLEQPGRQSLIQAVAVLDNRFEQGQVEAEDYRARREELMGRLRG